MIPELVPRILCQPLYDWGKSNIIAGGTKKFLNVAKSNDKPNDKGETNIGVKPIMWGETNNVAKPNDKATIWRWFIPLIYGHIGDALEPQAH